MLHAFSFQDAQTVKELVTCLYFFSQLDGKTSHKIILTVRSANPLTYTFPFNTNALSEKQVVSNEKRISETM